MTIDEAMTALRACAVTYAHTFLNGDVKEVRKADEGLAQAARVYAWLVAKEKAEREAIRGQG